MRFEMVIEQKRRLRFLGAALAFALSALALSGH